MKPLKMRSVLCACSTLFLAVLGPIACSEDEDSAPLDGGAEDVVADANDSAVADVSDGEDGGASIVLSGVVRRTADLSPNGDGVGTLCLEVVDTCPTPEDLSFTTVLGGPPIPDVDLTDSTASVPFSFVADAASLSSGTYALFGSLREAGGDCADAISAGDLVSVMLLGGAACPELVVSGPGEVSGLELYLNAVVP